MHRTDKDAQLLADSLESLLPIQFGILFDLGVDSVEPFLFTLHQEGNKGSQGAHQGEANVDLFDPFIVVIVGADYKGFGRHVAGVLIAECLHLEILDGAQNH